MADLIGAPELSAAAAGASPAVAAAGCVYNISRCCSAAGSAAGCHAIACAIIVSRSSCCGFSLSIVACSCCR